MESRTADYTAGRCRKRNRGARGRAPGTFPPASRRAAHRCHDRCQTHRRVKGSTIRITPPSDTRGSDRRARPFVRPAFGESPGPAVFGYRRARPSSVPDGVSPPRSARRTPRALARGADDRRSGRGRGTLGARSSKEPLRECVRPRCADRRSNDPDALGAEHRIERSGERGVPVAQEEPNTRKPLVDGEVPGLLR